MKTKTKSIFFAICAMILAMPVIASAQTTSGFQVPSGVTGVASGDLSTLLTRIINGLLGFVGVLGVLGFVVAGVMYLTAAGDEGKIETAKKTMIWSITGIVVALLGVVAVTTIKNLIVG